MRTMAELNCPLPIRSKNTILLGHGSGGRLSSELLQDVFLRELGNPILSKLEDQAIVPFGSQTIPPDPLRSCGTAVTRTGGFASRVVRQSLLCATNAISWLSGDHDA